MSSIESKKESESNERVTPEDAAQLRIRAVRCFYSRAKWPAFAKATAGDASLAGADFQFIVGQAHLAQENVPARVILNIR
jgi:hypothetical protein